MPFRLLLLALLICLTTPWAAVRGSDNPAPVADAQRLDRLIRQLGNDDFEEREAATEALARVGVPAMDALRKAASTNPDAEARRRADEIVVRIENGLDQLLVDYRAFGLPLPPDAAPLVRFEERPSGMISGGDGKGNTQSWRTPPTYALGFLVEPAAKERPAKLLHATEARERDGTQLGDALEAQQLTADYVKANLPDPPKALALALQMHARGWDAAKILFENGFREKGEHSARTELRLGERQEVVYLIEVLGTCSA